MNTYYVPLFGVKGIIRHGIGLGLVAVVTKISNRDAPYLFVSPFLSHVSHLLYGLRNLFAKKNNYRVSNLTINVQKYK